MHAHRESPRARCPSQFALEKFVHGEATAAIQDHVQHCPRCSKRLHDMALQGEAYARSAEAHRLRQELEAQRSRERPTSDWGQRLRRALLWGVAPVAITTGILFVLTPPAPIQNPAPGAFVAKGGGVLRVLHQSGEVTQDWTGGDLKTDDVLQLVWSAPQPGFVAVLSQTAETVAVLFPEGGSLAAPVRSGSEQTLGGSLIADAPTTGLRLWTFFSPQPFSTQPLEEALRRREVPNFHGQTLKVGRVDETR